MLTFRPALFSNTCLLKHACFANSFFSYISKMSPSNCLNGSLNGRTEYRNVSSININIYTIAFCGTILNLAIRYRCDKHLYCNVCAPRIIARFNHFPHITFVSYIFYKRCFVRLSACLLSLIDYIKVTS